jgi:hypothetical protein
MMLTVGERRELRRWAEERGMPSGTLAHEIVSRALSRRAQEGKP